MAARLKNKNKSRVNLEPRSAHGRAVNKSRVNLEPRSAHGRAVKKVRVNLEPRSAHGRAVKKKVRVNLEPRSAHGRAVNKPKVHYEPRSAHGRAVNNIRNIRLFVYECFNSPQRLRDSLLPLGRPSGDLRLVTDKTAKNKPRVDYEPRSAHGRAVNNTGDLRLK